MADYAWPSTVCMPQSMRVAEARRVIGGDGPGGVSRPRSAYARGAHRFTLRWRRAPIGALTAVRALWADVRGVLPFDLTRPDTGAAIEATFAGAPQLERTHVARNTVTFSVELEEFV